MAMTYKGRYKVKNPDKYNGDPANIVYRSGWERSAFKWLDGNYSIKSWASEEFYVPYICATDKKPHRYFVDLWYMTNEGEQFIIEIKPKKETIPPKNPGHRTRRFMTESLTYVKNQSKWQAAEAYANARGWKFAIWTEDVMKGMGIKIL